MARRPEGGVVAAHGGAAREHAVLDEDACGRRLGASTRAIAGRRGLMSRASARRSLWPKLVSGPLGALRGRGRGDGGADRRESGTISAVPLSSAAHSYFFITRQSANSINLGDRARYLLI